MALELKIVVLAVFDDGRGKIGQRAAVLEQRPVVLDRALERLPSEIEPVELGVALLELGQDAQGLRVVVEAAERLHRRMQRLLAGMPERRVAEIVSERHQPGLEAQIANLADEIAYNNHDVDDGLRAQLLDIGALREVRLFRTQHDAVRAAYPQLPERRLVHETIRRMVNCLVLDFIRATQAQLEAVRPRSIDEVRGQPQQLARLSQVMQEQHLELKEFLREHVYRHYKVLRMTSKARRLLRELFGAFFADVSLMPTEHRDLARHAESEQGIAGRARTVADYIAGMTDRYAILEHRRLFEPAERT